MNLNGNIIVPGRTSPTLDRRAAPAYVSTAAAAIMAETAPRWAIQAGAAPSANKVYLNRIALTVGSYTTVQMLIPTASTTTANAFVGLYDVTSLAKLAGSADLSSVINAAVVNTTASFTLNYTVTTAGDYYLAFCAGTPGTLQLARTAIASTDVSTLAPVMADRHNATVTNGALPDPAILQGGVTGQTPYWMRYS